MLNRRLRVDLHTGRCQVVEQQGERGRERERYQVARMGQLVERLGEVLVPERRRRDVRVRRQRQDRRESDEVQNAPEALPADEDEGGETSRRHQMFLEAKLQSPNRLADNNQTEAQDVGAQGRVPLFAEAARDAH